MDFGGGASAGFEIPPYTYFGQSEAIVVVRDVMTTSCGHIKFKESYLASRVSIIPYLCTKN